MIQDAAADAAADSAVDRYLLKLVEKTRGGEWPGVPGEGAREMRRLAQKGFDTRVHKR